MASSEEPEVVSAAHAVASWARARRATWAAPEPQSTATPVAATPPVAPTPPAVAPTKPSSPPPVPSSPAFTPEPIAATIGSSHRPAAEPFRAAPAFATISEPESTGFATWITRAAAVVAVLAAVGFGGKYLLTRSEMPAPAVPAPPAAAAVPAAVPRAGSVHVTSAPAGAHVIIDGKARGVTPLTVDALPVGRHVVELQSAEGTIRRTVSVEGGKTAEVDEAIYAGWVVVYAPFEITTTENGRSLTADERNQIMLSPGSHQLHMANATLGFEETRTVDVRPGQMTTVNVTPPPSSITVNASEAADVLIDGARAGTTPLSAFPIALGAHDIVVRRAAGGERRLSVTVTTKPLALDVDFSKP